MEPASNEVVPWNKMSRVMDGYRQRDQSFVKKISFSDAILGRCGIKIAYRGDKRTLASWLNRAQPHDTAQELVLTVGLNPTKMSILQTTLVLWYVHWYK